MDKREGPLPSLFLALRACVYAGTNQPELALTTAQRALGLDPNSIDAIAAIAEAAARMGRVEDSKEAIRRLAELSPREADAIARRLTVIGLARSPG
jgi:Tfp pilus assembly protein PilF